jgi:integrase
MKKAKKRTRGCGSIFLKPGQSRWFIQFYKDGRRVREATGKKTYAEAQIALNARLLEVANGEYQEHKGRAARIEELYEKLEENKVMNGKDVSSLKRRWKHLKPLFADLPAGELTTDAVITYTAKRRKAGAAKATVNRELATLKRMFRLGMRSRKVKSVPFIPMLDERDNVRRGFIEDGEFSRLLFAAEASESWLSTFLEMAFTYGWRKSELLSLQVRQVNLATRTIRLDAGTTKNGEGREVAMTAKVAELLQDAVADKTSEDYVLTRADGKRIKDFRAAWHNLCVRARLGEFFCRGCERTVSEKKCECGDKRRPKYQGLIPHDLRRSAAKALRRAGVPESVIMATGGWKTASMFRRYAIVSSSDSRQAMLDLERSRAGSAAESSAPISAPIAVSTASRQSESASRKVQ